MNNETKSQAFLIYQKMMQKDKYSEWLGLQLEEISEGKCTMHYTIVPEMLNGFETVHGGILFAASDSVFAFACNSHGLVAVALEASIHYFRRVTLGEVLSVAAELIFLGNKTGVYEMSTRNEKGELVCKMKATAYRSSQPAL